MTEFQYMRLVVSDLLTHNPVVNSFINSGTLLTRSSFCLYLFIYFENFIYLLFYILVAVGLCCGARISHCGGFSCCGARALGAWASVVVAHGLSSCGSRAIEHRLSSCSTRAQLFCSMWDLHRPRLESVSPALAGRLLTTVPRGKPPSVFSLTDSTHFQNFLGQHPFLSTSPLVRLFYIFVILLDSFVTFCISSWQLQACK